MMSIKRKRPHPLVLNCVSGSFEDKSNDFLCPICFEIIEEANVTKCGHTFCFKCISMSLERTNRCPKCNFIVEQVFPNFLLNELITKHHKMVLQKKIDSGKNNPREVSELQEILVQKSDQLDLSDVNLLLESLAQRKRQLETSCKVIENELLKDFLLQVRNHKQEQLDQLTREISLIDEDCRRVDELIANEALIKFNANNNNISDNNSNNADSSSILDREVWPSPEPSSSSASAFPSLESTATFNKSNLTASEVREPWLTSSLTNRRKKMHFHFEDLEQCYFTTRAKSLVLSSSDDDTSIDGLHEFSDTLNKFTSFSSLRPLATLCYASDLFTGSSIVSSIEFDKESEYFAIAGVTKKIKVFEYATVVKDTLDIHYPINEMECTSKISCVSWSSYYKAMMASSDYEGTVTIWDAFTGQKVRTFQEHEKRCWSVDFNKVDTKLVASGSDDAKVKLWSANMENSVTSLEAKANVCSVKFNPCSRYHLAFGSADHCVHYYDLRNTKNPLMVFKGHKKAVSYVKFLNKEEIVSASTDSQLKLWSTEKTPTVRSFKGHINEKNFVGLATDGDFIACGSENNALFVYYKGLSKQVLTFWFDSVRVLDRDKREDDTSDFVSAVCWRAGSNVVVAANSQGTIKSRISAANRLDNCYDSRGSLTDDITTQSHHQQRRMAVMSEIEEQERKIVNEFCHFLEKSKQLFNGLRDLPQYGHKQWQPYFGRTFDVYTKLWKFQQQHRQVLDAKYGLKRWQIGEIASKIGQLYYHYYLRTSETNYLNEAFSFYSAIRARGYYSKASKEERADLMVKKLRYFARFIVVCLLLKKMKLVRDLVRELAKQIDDYTMTYDPDDQLEWSLVLSEIKSFIEADNIVTVVDMDNIPLIISHRLSPLNTPPMEKVVSSHLTLQEILIVGNCSDQVKFSELTLDMFRMLQALEREPQEDITQMYDVSPAPGRMPFAENGDHRSTKRDNPHKYLLYKPTFSQFFVFLASGFKELPANGVLLLYLSADGCFVNNKHPDDVGYDYGGVITNTKVRESEHSNKRNMVLKDMHCLYPGDLYPFIRRPLFLIVDSDNSTAFQHIPRFFGQPLVVLMSPEECPPPFHDQQHKGSLFTLFLHCPLTAICLISNIIELSIQLWEKGQQQIDRFLAEAGRLMVRARNIDPAYLQFYSDDFLRLQVLRFVFCSVVMKMHRLFKGRRSYFPKSHPPIPENEIIDSPSLRRLILETAVILDIRSLFSDVEEE